MLVVGAAHRIKVGYFAPTMPESLIRMAKVEHIIPPRSEPSMAATPEGKFPVSNRFDQTDTPRKTPPTLW
jgi:hypothetical protein